MVSFQGQMFGLRILPRPRLHRLPDWLPPDSNQCIRKYGQTVDVIAFPHGTYRWRCGAQLRTRVAQLPTLPIGMAELLRTA